MHVPLDPALVDSCRQVCERLLLDSFCVTISIRLASSGNRFSQYRSKPLQGHMMNKIRLIGYVSFIAIFTAACSSGDGGSGSDSDDDDTPIEVIPSPTMAKEVLISELMIDPALPVNLGEWFEIQNPGNRMLNLQGCVFEDDGGGNFSIGFDLIIKPGGYKTFATSANHLFFPDVIYDRIALTLNNPADTLYLSCNGIAIDSRTYPLPTRSQSSALSNNGNAMWCDDRVNRYNGTDAGTPGSANIDCL
jgi:hypothetical protein